MLLQSHAGEIQLMPALPSWFKDVAVTALCAPGGFEVDSSWQKDVLAAAAIYSKLENECRLQTSQHVKVLEGSKPIQFLRAANNIIIFKT